MKAFTFADTRAWTDETLHERLVHLDSSAEIPHGESRRADISRELLHLSFEIGQRVIDNCIIIKRERNERV